MARNRLGEALTNALFTYGMGKTPRQIQQEREALNLKTELDQQKVVQLNLANALSKIQLNTQKAKSVQLGLEIDRLRLQNARQEQLQQSDFYKKPVFDVGIGENLSLEQIEGLPPVVQQYLLRSTPYAQERLQAEQGRLEVARGNLGARERQIASTAKFKRENLKSRDSRELSRLEKERGAKRDELAALLRGSEKFSVLQRAYTFFPEDKEIFPLLQQSSPEAIAEYLLSKNPEEVSFLLRPYSKLRQVATDLENVNQRLIDFQERFSGIESEIPIAPPEEGGFPETPMVPLGETSTIVKRSEFNARQAQEEAMRPSAALQQLTPEQKELALETLRQARALKSSRGETLTSEEALGIINRSLGRAGKQSVEEFQKTAPQIAKIKVMGKGKAKRTLKTLLIENGIKAPNIDIINSLLNSIRDGQIVTTQGLLDSYAEFNAR